jgi:hypothetical protein
MKRTLIVAIAIAGLLAGCSGASGVQAPPATPVPQATSAGTAQAAISIKVPVKQASAAGSKAPAYISPDTKSISFQVPSMGSPQVVALNIGGSNCPQVGDNFVCTAYFSAPVGLAQALTIKTFASSDGSGTPLSQNTASLDVKVGQVNPINVTLNGVVATLGLYLSPNYLNSGTPSTVTAIFEAFDTAGDLIVAPGTLVDATNTAVSPTLSTSDLTGAITVGAYNSSSTSWSVSYNGAAIASPNMTVSASGYTSAGLALTVYSAGETPSPSPTPSPTPTGGPTATPNAGPTMIPTPAAFGTPGAACDATAPHCGTERWHIKTLDDLYASSVNYTPILVDVDTLRAIPIPAGYSSNNDTTRYSPTETQAVTLRAVLLDWKTETDHDFHIVVGEVGNPADTMIIEPPDQTCNAACASNFGADFNGVRTKLTTCFNTNPPSSVQPFPTSGVIVDITGIPYFDPLHGQTGVAPNGIEIHPVLNINFVSGQPC